MNEQYKVTITSNDGVSSVQWFHLASSAMHVFLDCTNRKIACKIEYFPS